ncbi:MAG TPA: dihydrofolate reductase family protein [Thermoanaerobaculia bacterium]|jgi:5-amino-6-(5-phosphoribosylamino)uracil reductase/2,5-diamino-6-(ribosylamino)-4(3H)-pyrimidinone 5'-phosphate reductase|nr:dihydrofolate reductase family protein [Thermoanaerobaculia bacterium]
MIDVTTVTELTIDGKLSLGAGSSSRALFHFYGSELRAWFHEQRALNDAVMVGAGTVRIDDPELTVRYARGPNPLRIVPSSDGLLPLGAKVLNDGGATLIAVAGGASAQAVAALASKPAVEVVRCGKDRVELPALITLLQARGVKSLMVEGGSRLLHSLFEAGLVSRIVIKHIPVISGALDAPTYLSSCDGRSSLELTRWRLTDLFIKSGVGISIYLPLETTV